VWRRRRRKAENDAQVFILVSMPCTLRRKAENDAQVFILVSMLCTYVAQ
jgi:hypothetical protein